jgi:type I restriction enzyme S subunit
MTEKFSRHEGRGEAHAERANPTQGQRVGASPQLPQGWQWITIGEIVTFEYGKGLRADKRDQSGRVPVYGSNGIVGYHTNSLVEEPCLVAGRKGAAGELHKSTMPCWPIDTTYYVVPPNDVDLSFLFYLFSTLQFGALDKSTAIPGLNRNDAYALPIPLAPINEQHRIVAKIEELFTQLDAGVAALEQAGALLKRYRQAVLKAAVTGELTREWREALKDEIEPADRLLERILKERREKWEEEQRAKGKDPSKMKYKDPAWSETDGLEDLPEGWVWATVDQLTAHEPNSFTDGPFGLKLKTAHYTEEGPRVIRLQNIGDGAFNDEEAHISWRHFETLKKHEIFAGDLVIGALGSSLPRACIIPEHVCPAIVKADCMRFKPHYKIANVRYINAALNSKILKNIAANIIHGVGRPRLNQQEVRMLPIPLPTPYEQEVIVTEVERCLSLADEIERQLEQSLIRARRLRQSILKQAFEGSLVVQDPKDEPASLLLKRIKLEQGERNRPTSKQMGLFDD